MIPIFTSKTPPDNHNIIWLRFKNNTATLNIFIGDDWKEIGSLDITNELEDIINRVETLESKIDNPTDSSEIVETDQEGVYITDSKLNPVIQYDSKGFDVPKLSEHFKSLLGDSNINFTEIKIL